MSRRVSLFDDLDEIDRGPEKRRRELEPESLEELLEKMETILHIKTYQVGRGPWHARATGASNFGTGMTPVEAMRDALIVKGTKG